MNIISFATRPGCLAPSGGFSHVYVCSYACSYACRYAYSYASRHFILALVCLSCIVLTSCGKRRGQGFITAADSETQQDQGALSEDKKDDLEAPIDVTHQEFRDVMPSALEELSSDTEVAREDVGLSSEADIAAAIVQRETIERQARERLAQHDRRDTSASPSTQLNELWSSQQKAQGLSEDDAYSEDTGNTTTSNLLAVSSSDNTAIGLGEDSGEAPSEDSTSSEISGGSTGLCAEEVISEASLNVSKKLLVGFTHKTPTGGGDQNYELNALGWNSLKVSTQEVSVQLGSSRGEMDGKEKNLSSYTPTSNEVNIPLPELENLSIVELEDLTISWSYMATIRPFSDDHASSVDQVEIGLESMLLSEGLAPTSLVLNGQEFSLNQILKDSLVEHHTQQSPELLGQDESGEVMLFSDLKATATLTAGGGGIPVLEGHNSRCVQLAQNK